MSFTANGGSASANIDQLLNMLSSKDTHFHMQEHLKYFQAGIDSISILQLYRKRIDT